MPQVRILRAFVGSIAYPPIFVNLLVLWCFVPTSPYLKGKSESRALFLSGRFLSFKPVHKKFVTKKPLQCKIIYSTNVQYIILHCRLTFHRDCRFRIERTSRSQLQYHTCIDCHPFATKFSMVFRISRSCSATPTFGLRD